MSQRAQMMAALAADEIVVDLFCGGGGATQGIEDAGLVVAECVNHCPTAIATHAVNHPSTNHRQGDVWKNTPRSVAAGRPVGLLWASPDCRHFSRARGAAPVSRRVRDLAWVVTRWAEDVRPRVIIVENVPELMTWGPIRSRRDAQGRPVKDGQGRAVMEPVPERKGETFRRWVNKLKRCGYVVEWRVLDAADYGAASRRKRLYVVARCDGVAIEWPEVTHGRGVDARVVGASHAARQGCRNRLDDAGRGRGWSHDAGSSHGDRLRQAPTSSHRASHRAAAEVIDWSDLGSSIFDRRRPLADKTLARIAEGIRRYVIAAASPFVLRVTQTGQSGGWKVSVVNDPLPTQTTRQDLAVVSPVFQALRGNAAARPPEEPLPTITAGNGPGRGAGAGHALGVIAPVLATTGYGEREGQRPRCSPIGGTLGTCVDGVKQGLVSPVLMVARNHCSATPVDGPMSTVAAGGQHHGVVLPVLMHNTTHHTGAAIDGLVPTVTTGGQTGLVSPLVLSAGGPECSAVPADRPMGTVLPRDHRAVAAACLVAFYGSESGGRDVVEPLGTVTTLDRHGVSAGVLSAAIDAAELVLARARRCAAMMWYLAGVEPGADGLVWVETGGERRLLVDILFRMLKPRELAAAMGFPASYVWPATQREAVRLIGNAVSPPQAAALVRTVLPGGRRSLEVSA